MSRASVGLAVAFATFALGARAQTNVVTIPATAETATPLQRGLRAMLAERQAAGLPVPASVEYTYEVVEGAPPSQALGAQSLAAADASRSVTIVGRAVLGYDAPEQAGYDVAWPPLVLRNTAPPGAGPGVVEGDYTEAYRAWAEQQVPGVWEHFEFGREPRTYTIEETITVTFPEGANAASALARALTAEPLGAGRTVEDVLLGFTYAGPDIDHTIGARVAFRACLPWPFGDICFDLELFEFKAGFALSWAFGLRLPIEVAMSGPLDLAAGSSAPFYSDVLGTDWLAERYDGTGVAAYDGNEFVFQAYFFAGVKVEIFNADACTPMFGRPCYIELDVNESTSFATPFGTDAWFPIGYAEVPLYEVGIEDILYFALGFRLQPLIGSLRITADGAVVPGGSASGAATLAYAQPQTGVPLEVSACIVPGESREAAVQLQNFRYWFTRFLVDLSVYGRVDFLGNTFDPGYTIYTFDLSELFDGTPSLGRHVQCDALFNCGGAGPDAVVALAANVVDATPPVTTLAVAGVEGKEHWYRSDVTLTLSAIDLPEGCGSGVASTAYSLGGVPGAYDAPIPVQAEGITPFSYGSTDLDGQQEAPLAALLKIDKTAPVVSGACVPPANAYGWHGGEVLVDFTASDALSGLDTATPDPTLSAEGAGQSATGTAWDLAGNQASATVSDIHIDRTPPTLALASPQPGAYANTATFTVAWTASDALSGIATESGSLEGVAVENGAPLSLVLFAPGTYAARVEVSDRADHAVEETVTFEVTLDLPGLLAAQGRVCELDWVHRYGICVSLEAKLLAALSSTGMGDALSTANQLGAFLNELDAQWNKAISPEAYELLRADAQYVLDHLG